MPRVEGVKNASGKQGLYVDAAEIGLKHVCILKASDVQGMLFQYFVFDVKAINLPAFNQGLAFEPLPNQRTRPKAFNLLVFVHAGIL